MMLRVLILILPLAISGCGGSGSSSSDSDPPETGTQNQPPVADAGMDQTVIASQMVNLNGTGTDSDGSITQYIWTQSAGPEVSLTAANTAQTAFTAPEVTTVSVLTFRLTVTDNNGATHADSVDITVQPSPAIPTTISLSSSAATLDRWQDQLQLEVDSVRDQHGNNITDYQVDWFSDNTDVASVSQGLVSSNKEGTVNIRATVTTPNGAATAISVITVAVQQNPQCKAPPAPTRSTVAPAATYTEVASNTAAQLENGWHRSFAPDLNNDGLADMLWLESSWISATKEMPNTASVWLSNGDGNFTNATNSYLPDTLPVDVPRQLFEADITGNGKLDYIVLQHGYDPGGLEGLGCGDEHGTICPGAANMLISVGDDGKLRDMAPSTLSPYDTNGFTHAGGVADADCDGDIDILEGQLTNDIASAPNRLQLNDGNGNFVDKAGALPAEVAGIGFYGAAFCDLDADGDPDIYIAQLGVLPGIAAADIVLANDGTGSFRLLPGRRAPESRVGDSTQRPADLKCLDYDGDGYNDILKPNEADENYPAFELLRNNGDMTFTDVTDSHFVQTPLLGGAYRPFIADLNSDGWPDVLAQGTGDYLRIYWNNGNGFTEYRFAQDTAIDTRGASTTLADFNGDGRTDIHIGRSNYESFVLLSN